VYRRQRQSDGTAELPPPLLLVATELNQLIVRRCCLRARAAGVRAGMTLSLARALIPEAATAPYAPRSDLLALHRLAVWLLRCTPLAGIEGDLLKLYRHDRTLMLPEGGEANRWGLTLDLTGTERLHQGEERVIGEIRAKLTRAGITARYAIAPTIGAAWALARYGPGDRTILPTTTPLREALAPFPVQALRLRQPTIAALREVGITTVQEVLKLPARTLTVRFGPELLNRIDQALGRVDEGVTPVRLPRRFALRRRFESPLTTQLALQTALLALLRRLLEELERAGRKAGSFLLITTARGYDGEPRRTVREISLHAATRDSGQIVSIIAPALERLETADGVHEIGVAAHGIETAHHDQGDFAAGSDAHHTRAALDELMNTLVARLGRTKVQRAIFHQSYLPEHSYSFSAIDSADPDNAPPIHLRGVERPPCLLARPERVDGLAMLPDRPPSRLRWHNQDLRIIAGSGPERITAEWWHTPLTGDFRERDYFKVQAHTGQWLWVFRNRTTMEWFVHGVWV